MSIGTLMKLSYAFPNLINIQGIIDLTSYGSSSTILIFPANDKLEHISHWFHGYNSKWMETLHNNLSSLKSLEFTMSDSKYWPSLPISNITSTSSTTSGRNIYTISLPVMPSLTHLCIDCFSFNIPYNGDEHMFESIHDSCPQLKSLTLNHFFMDLSENYSTKMMSQISQPNIYLKELCIDGEFYNPKCYNYLSFKYSHLESLSLSLIEVDSSESSDCAFKTAAYKMITQYNRLKKLKTRFKPKTDGCKSWPHIELLEWLQQNPTKLKCLDYPYTFKIEQLEMSTDNNINLSSINPFPSSVKFKYLPIQQHHYLNCLTTLSLEDESSYAIDALFYFYICNNNSSDSNVISNSIEELNLKFNNFGYIYFWLDGFPNLKSLKIIGSNGNIQVTDSIDDIDDHKCSVSKYYREILYYLKNKMKQQEQSLNDSSSLSTSSALSSLSLSSASSASPTASIKSYKLKKLEFKDCTVNFNKHGWNGFFKRLTNLKTIILSKINELKRIDNEEYKDLVKPIAQQFTFDISHLSLDLLKIHKFNYEPLFTCKFEQQHYVKELMINEISLDKVYYLKHDSISSNTSFNYPNSTTLIIKCKYIDYIIFQND
ncbi:unnamed protein product [Cunninghamella blakesleeana]